MDYVESVMLLLNALLDTNRKRHIVGGMLLSVSMLFGGLALTVITIKKEENGHE